MSNCDDMQYYVLLAIVILMVYYFLTIDGDAIANAREVIFI
ncbi:hypothetical protein [Desulfuribacillus alkaliarsenatis]|nr:hypothetical protein [Desulfuribacillus alkaliarsenatis]